MANNVIVESPVPLPIITRGGERVSVEVKNTQNIPVEVKNSPIVKTQAPAFLTQGGEYVLTPVAGVLPDTFKNPVRIRDIDYYPWIFVEHVTGPPRDLHTEPTAWINVELMMAIKQYRR